MVALLVHEAEGQIATSRGVADRLERQAATLESQRHADSLDVAGRKSVAIARRQDAELDQPIDEREVDPGSFSNPLTIEAFGAAAQGSSVARRVRGVNVQPGVADVPVSSRAGSHLQGNGVEPLVVSLKVSPRPGRSHMPPLLA